MINPKQTPSNSRLVRDLGVLLYHCRTRGLIRGKVELDMDPDKARRLKPEDFADLLAKQQAFSDLPKEEKDQLQAQVDQMGTDLEALKQRVSEQMSKRTTATAMIPESNAMIVILSCGVRCKVERLPGDGNWWSFTPIKRDGTPDMRWRGWSGCWESSSVIERAL